MNQQPQANVEPNPITDLFVQCSFDMRTPQEAKRGPAAMSDCCRRHAISAVYAPNGDLYWRCIDHEGELTPGVFGSVTKEVMRRG